MRYGGLGMMGDQIVLSTTAWDACQDKCQQLMNKWRGKPTGPEPEAQAQRMEEYWQAASNQLMRKLSEGERVRVLVDRF